MNVKKWSVPLILAAAVAYVAMVVVNALANILPLNGVTTGAISDEQPTLFAPAGYTFAVWGVIYALLAAYVVTELLRLWKSGATPIGYLKVDLFFAVSSLANIAWIFAWHHRLFLLTVILMLVILVSLIFISFRLGPLSVVAKAAFGVYFGWITVASVANVATWLVSIGVLNMSVSATLRTVAVMILALALAVATLLVQKNLGYGLVVLWAFIGIVVRHVDPLQFAGGFIAVKNTAIFAVVLLAAANLFTAYRLIRPLLERAKA